MKKLLSIFAIITISSSLAIAQNTDPLKHPITKHNVRIAKGKEGVNKRYRQIKGKEGIKPSNLDKRVERKKHRKERMEKSSPKKRKKMMERREKWKNSSLEERKKMRKIRKDRKENSDKKQDRVLPGERAKQ